MMTVYVMVMTLCRGDEGCVDVRKTEPTYLTKELCMAKARDITPRKGVKFKCRSERSWGPSKIPGADTLTALSRPTPSDSLETRLNRSAYPSRATPPPTPSHGHRVPMNG